MPGGDVFFSVDVETSGPVPGRYSLLSIGACRVDDPAVGFCADVRPEGDSVDAEALAVSGLSLARLAIDGEPPRAAMQRFADWVRSATPPTCRAVFVAFNAPFDWMFVADALHRHTGDNPFGHAALDIKALAMGALGLDWAETSFASLAARLGVTEPLPHRALDDARLQAEVFRRILSEISRR